MQYLTDPKPKEGRFLNRRMNVSSGKCSTTDCVVNQFGDASDNMIDPLQWQSMAKVFFYEWTMFLVK